jgi:pimeloyl-ACP methyl ester carboxylesterase
MSRMPRPSPSAGHPAEAQQARVRRGYFECRFGQLHVHNAMPRGGGFEEGTPLLCLHDVAGSAWVFARFLALAGRDRSVFAPDLPGFGESDPPPVPPSIADYAAALGDFLDNLRLRHVDVLGFRGGTVLATELALERPAQIGRVVMVSVPLLSDGERHALARAAPPAGSDHPWRSADGPRWGAQAAASYPLRERLSRLKQRLLVLRPRDDLSEATLRVRELLPGTRVSEVELTGAELFGAAPGQLAEAVHDFLRS